ncbi:MAG: dihydroneopterin aldolase [Leptothrix sp. (in: b-proteobacteria)]
MDLIFIEGYVGHTVIGIHVSELHDTQPLVIDVTAGLPRSRACATDAIADTIDYGVVRDRLDALMLDHGVTLLEALAERIARLLLVDFRAAWVRVKVVKPRKFDNVQAVGVQIERSRADLPRTEIAAAARVPAAATGAAEPRSAQVLSFIGAGMVPRPD